MYALSFDLTTLAKVSSKVFFYAIPYNYIVSNIRSFVNIFFTNICFFFGALTYWRTTLRKRDAM